MKTTTQAQAIQNELATLATDFPTATPGVLALMRRNLEKALREVQARRAVGIPAIRA